MNIDDARVVLEWLGYEAPKAEGSQYWRRERDWRCTLPHESGVCGHAIDATWIMEKLVSALEERLGLRYGAFWPLGDEVEVSISTPDAMFRGTGPTFEAAMISAAARAVRS